MTPEELEQLGFREFPRLADGSTHDREWQYCRRDDKGKRFYVQVRFWRFSKFSNPNYTVEDSWDAHAQFNDGERYFSVELLYVRDLTPKQVADWFESVWDRMGCKYYEKDEE